MERPQLSAIHVGYLRRLLSDSNYHPYTDFSEAINNQFGTKFTYYDVDKVISALGSYHRQKAPALFALDSESRHHLHFLYYVERIKETTYLLQKLNKKFNKSLQFCDVDREVKVMTEFAKGHPQGYLTRKEYDERAVKEQEQHSSQPGFWKQDRLNFQYPREPTKDRDLSKILGDWELPYMQRDLSEDKPVEERLLEILNAVDTQPLADPIHSCQSLDYVRYAERAGVLQPRVSPTLTQSVISLSKMEQNHHYSSPKMHHTSTAPLANVPSTASYTDGNKRKISTTDESTITDASSRQSSRSQPMVNESSPVIHSKSQQLTSSPIAHPTKKPRLNLHPVQKVTNTIAMPPMASTHRMAAHTTPMENYYNQENLHQPMTNMQYVAMGRHQTYPRANSLSTRSMQRSGSAPTVGANTLMAQEAVIDLTGPDVEQHQAKTVNIISRAYEANYWSNMPLPSSSNANLFTIPAQPSLTARKNVNGQSQASHSNQTFANRQDIRRSPTALHSSCNTTRNLDRSITPTGLRMDNSNKDFSLDYTTINSHNGTGTFANSAQLGCFSSNNGAEAQGFVVNHGIPTQNRNVVQQALRRPPLQSPRPIDYSSKSGSIMIGTPLSESASTCLTRPTFTLTRPRPAPSSQQQNRPIPQQMSHQQLPTQQQFCTQQVTPHTFHRTVPKTQMESMQYTFDANQLVGVPQPQQPRSFPARQVSQSHIIQTQQEHISDLHPLQDFHTSYQQEQRRQTTPRSHTSEIQGAQEYQEVQDYLWLQGIQNGQLEQSIQQAQDNQDAYVIRGSQGSQIGQGLQVSPSPYFEGFFG